MANKLLANAGGKIKQIVIEARKNGDLCFQNKIIGKRAAYKELEKMVNVYN